MLDRRSRSRWLAIPLAAAMFAMGCTATRSGDPVPDPVYYPATPSPPRLQFLTSFSDATDRQHTQSRTSFSDWVVGQDRRAIERDTSFRSPYGLAVHDDQLYICDLASRRVHVLNLRTNDYRTLQTPQRLRNPVNITIAEDGTRYLCDAGLGKVLIFDEDDRFIGEIAGEGDWAPFDLLIRNDELYLTNTRAAHVEVWSRDGHLLRTIGEKGEGPDQFAMPINLALGPDDQLYVVDTYHRAVKVFDPDRGHYLRQIGGPGNRVGSFARPKGIAIDDHGVVYVGDSQYNVIQMFEGSGQLLMVFGERGTEPWSMGMPAGLLIDRDTVEAFRSYLAPDFDPQYLLFVVNQFGRHKISVFAFGRDTSLPDSAYEVDRDAVTDHARRQDAGEQP